MSASKRSDKRSDYIDFRQGDLLVGRPNKPDGTLHLERPNRYIHTPQRPCPNYSFSLDECVVLILSAQRAGKDAFADSEVLVSDCRRQKLMRGWMTNYCLMNDFWIA